jgi:hypothetical protein
VNCPLSLGLSSSDLLPNFQKLRLLDFGALSGSAGDASDISGSAEEVEDAGKAPGRRGVRDPRDSTAPRSPVFTDCCCCTVDIFDTRRQMVSVNWHALGNGKIDCVKGQKWIAQAFQEVNVRSMKCMVL